MTVLPIGCKYKLRRRPKTSIFEYEQLCIAVGRSGSGWLRNICIKNDIKLLNSSVDIGVRVECPRSVTDEVTNHLYEFKIVNYSSSDNKVRTFCVNPGGYVVQENYDDCVCVNGHSLSDNKCLNTNFALLVSCNFTIRWRVSQLSRSIRKVSKLKNCLARPCLALLIRAARPFGRHRDGVPRILPESMPHVKPIFAKKWRKISHFL